MVTLFWGLYLTEDIYHLQSEALPGVSQPTFFTSNISLDFKIVGTPLNTMFKQECNDLMDLIKFI
jgi:hypothetical protein